MYPNQYERGMDMTLEQMMRELRYTNETEQILRLKIRKDEASVAEIAETAYQEDNFNFPLCRRMPLTRLAVVTYLLVQKYQDYKAIGIPDAIIFDTFRDVSLRADLYYQKHGKVGISKEDVVWFRHIMKVGMFKIGVLQFQPFEMIYLDEETIGEPYMTFTKEQKKALPPGSPVLNCHIQQGADLSPQRVTASFQEAKRFFSKYVPTIPYQAFLCYSWLLYPPMLAHLPDDSNIRQFANHFSMIGLCQDPEQALENLFGTGARKKLPDHATSLQTLAWEHPEHFGFACGIISI